MRTFIISCMNYFSFLAVLIIELRIETIDLTAYWYSFQLINNTKANKRTFFLKIYRAMSQQTTPQPPPTTITTTKTTHWQFNRTYNSSNNNKSKRKWVSPVTRPVRFTYYGNNHLERTPIATPPLQPSINQSINQSLTHAFTHPQKNINQSKNQSKVRRQASK